MIKLKAEASEQSLPVHEEIYKDREITTQRSSAKYQAEICSQTVKKVDFMSDVADKVKLNFTTRIDQEATITRASSNVIIKEKVDVNSLPSVVAADHKGKTKAEQGPTSTIKKKQTNHSKSLAKSAQKQEEASTSQPKVQRPHQLPKKIF